MEIRYKNIVLRRERLSDIDDQVRWHTAETDWAKWDAPWESEEDIRNFDEEKFRLEEAEFLEKPEPEIRTRFEIETEEGIHIGSVSLYYTDEDFCWIPKSEDSGEKKHFTAVGIDIRESSFCGKGFGRAALEAYIGYLLEKGITEILTQTWSGNFRMIKLAEKLGFREIRRKKDYRTVRGEKYDGLTFLLDEEAFRRIYGKRQ